MADDNKTEETPETKAPAAEAAATESKSEAKPVEIDQPAKAETEHAVTKEAPAIADTPSEAADNQSPAQGAEGQPRDRQNAG
ncbi:MAG: 30S ribosomal protein S5, partial [Alphaproteobacteria bacterium]|nr:30S ribosomal protein S5 [Alphaproteobacteria bacterium]